MADSANPIIEAVAALERLFSSLEADLDEDKFGFGWWEGYLDSPRRALIAEYLVASTGGVRQSLEDAAFLLTELKQFVFSDDDWVGRQLTAARNSDVAGDEILRYLHRDSGAAKRERRIRLAKEHIPYHLAQALDRLAAVVIGVGAFEGNVLKADASFLSKEMKPRRLRGQTTRGEAAQRELLAVASQALEVGPTDWSRWLNGQRNTAAHRAPRMNFVVMKVLGKRSFRFREPFYRQPHWSETETLAAARDDAAGMRELLVMEDPEDLLEGLIRSSAKVCADVAQEAHQLWMKRRTDPTLLIQPGSQWPVVFGLDHLEFAGYGHTFSVDLGDRAHVHPSTARRLKAAGVFTPELWTPKPEG